MCGRFTLRTPQTILIKRFGDGIPDDLRPRYNIAPTQTILAIRQPEFKREILEFRWGLIPFWAKEAKIGYSLINARADTVATKPSFRAAFKKRRCLILADGYYEWQKLDAKNKQPYHIHMKDNRTFTFAGLWESWTDPESKKEIESCTIVTTDANEATAKIHDRMPVILDEAARETWLDSKIQDGAKLEPLLAPYAEKDLVFDPISTYVNSPKNQGEKCLEPA